MQKKPGQWPDWRGIDVTSMDVGTRNKPHRWRHNGYQYCTAGEYRMAVLLEKQGIPFTPDVQFMLDDDGWIRPFVVDFIFDRRYLWTGGRGKPRVIDGIEAKGKSKGNVFKPKALRNVEVLSKNRGINILLMSNAQIRVYSARGKLPMKPI